ncbi:hypothetical protein F442_01496 [Phytophthora nicotianae P10297]|uniref:Uncharacterized protein n=2 Tax=Phytophthora nicotianae TaxID=4792 RepID=W3A372_PHYNI|nr:hypothetical protein L917_01432 [Phytophthora nicotianae]ETP53621.1 hypothetical protein F442_01496 [Phytophthora nicotianae P10297]
MRTEISYEDNDTQEGNHKATRQPERSIRPPSDDHSVKSTSPGHCTPWAITSTHPPRLTRQ